MYNVYGVQIHEPLKHTVVIVRVRAWCVCVFLFISRLPNNMFIHRRLKVNLNPLIICIRMQIYRKRNHFLSIDMWLNGNETFYAHPFQCVQCFNFSISICFRFVLFCFFLYCYRYDDFFPLRCQLIRIDWVCFLWFVQVQWLIVILVVWWQYNSYINRMKTKRERKKEIDSPTIVLMKKNKLSVEITHSKCEEEKKKTRHRTLTLFPCFTAITLLKWNHWNAQHFCIHISQRWTSSSSKKPLGFWLFF